MIKGYTYYANDKLLLQISSCLPHIIFSHRENIDVHLQTVLLFTEADSNWS